MASPLLGRISKAQEPGDGITVLSPTVPGHRAALAGWFSCIAPGTLGTRMVVLLAIIIAPFLLPIVYVEPPLRYGALALLLAHVVAAGVILRPSRGWVALTIGWTMLASDVVLCGVMLGAAAEVRSPATAMLLVVLAIGFQMGGWRALPLCSAAIALVTAVTLWVDLGTPLLFSPVPSYPKILPTEASVPGAPVGQDSGREFSTILTVDPSFAGRSALRLPAYTFAAALRVDTSFAGVPATGSSGPLFVPALALAWCAIAFGGALSLLRVRRRCRARWPTDRRR